MTIGVKYSLGRRKYYRYYKIIILTNHLTTYYEYMKESDVCDESKNWTKKVTAKDLFHLRISLSLFLKKIVRK